MEKGWIEDPSTQDPLTFIKDTKGKGALQVSLVTFDMQKRPTLDELLESNVPSNLKEYNLREWNVYEFDETAKEFYRKNFYFIKTHVFVYISYYGGLESKESNELKEAIHIAQSISVINKN